MTKHQAEPDRNVVEEWEKEFDELTLFMEVRQEDGPQPLIIEPGDRGRIKAFIRKVAEATRAAERAKLREVVEGMNEQNVITQAILGALEYRGFSDAGKYLDGDIWERIKPVILTTLEDKK